MKSLKHLSYYLIVFLFISCTQNGKWKGQDPIKKVDTHTVPIQLQYKGIFDMGKGVFLSNDFIGARLNGAARTNDTLLSILITPENEKINPSPWYAFKIWSEKEQDISINFIYPENVGHRYYPKLSYDGLVWERLDSSAYHIDMSTTIEGQSFPKNMRMKIHIGPDTLCVSAQELNTTLELEKWLINFDSLPFVSLDTIGYSVQGRPLKLLRIGAKDDQRMLFVLSRQHPPEVTGYLAMQAFIETLCSTSELAEAFRNEYTVYVLPMANPDGVDNGHWRHNYGGVDLNRDWADFNQPETRAIRDFMKEKVAESGGKFYFAMDFHSTYEDIYYTEDPVAQGNMPGLVSELISASAQKLENYEPNIKSGLDKDARVSSTSFFFYEFGAESFTYEIGDSTPRSFVRKKGEITAITLMELMLNDGQELHK